MSLAGPQLVLNSIIFYRKDSTREHFPYDTYSRRQKKKKKYIQFNIVKIYRTLYPNLLE